MRKGRHVTNLVESVERTTDGDEVVSRQDAGSELERLSRAGVVEESMSLCLPNPLSLDFSIEHHLDKCRDQLNL